MTERTPAGDALTEIVLATFRLHGLILEVSDRLAKPAGLTTAWWQVIGAVLREPQSVSDIARAMGLTRQSVQRTADVLVERGLATYEPNPRHARAKLVRPTQAAWDAIALLRDAQHAWTNRVTDGLDEAKLRAMLATMGRLSDAIEADSAELRTN